MPEEDLQHRAARAILGTLPLIMRTLGKSMHGGASEVSPQQFRLLDAIGRRPRTLGMVARIQGVTPATATTIVSTLENRGWVRREHDPADRRRIIVSLTDSGREALAAATVIAEDAMAAILTPLSVEDLERVRLGLGVLAKLPSADSQQERKPAAP